MSIVKKSIRQTTGDETNVSQSFSHNIFFSSKGAETTPFTFHKPMYTTIGGTKDYYGQNPLAIFTNLVKPFIRYSFSANTSGFSETVYIKHDVYKVDWETYKTARKFLKESEYITNQQEDTPDEEVFNEIEDLQTEETEIIEEVVEDVDEEIEEPQVDELEISIDPSIIALRDMLSEPLVSFTASTSGITTNIYDFQPEQFVKKFGEFKQELFTDKSQYIIDTNFIFEYDVTPGLTDYLLVDYSDEAPEDIEAGEGFSLTSLNYSETIIEQTKSKLQAITAGTFSNSRKPLSELSITSDIDLDDSLSGLTFKGGTFFSYIEVPDKPIFEYPSPSGKTDTFTPEIFWSNGDEADEYVVQVNYNTGDTGFTGTVFTYSVPKTDNLEQEAVNKLKKTDIEFDSTKSIRKYQLSLKSNSSLLYRVGNVKFIENIFGVKQSVITFSENKEIYTQTEPIKTFVYSENDSPYIDDIAGLGTPPSIELESSMGMYTLSGTVSGSVVTGATLQVIYPNGNSITKPTTSTGEFYFEDLSEGVYTVNTNYRGYATDSVTVNMTGNTNISINLEVKWDNEFDIWADKESDTIKY